MAADQNREINILDSTAMPLNDAQIGKSNFRKLFKHPISLSYIHFK